MSEHHDAVSEIVWAHPDEKPNTKACKECAFRPHNPQGLDVEDLAYLHEAAAYEDGFTFHCVHRDCEGYSRECASFHAIRTGVRHGSRKTISRTISDD